MNFVFYDTETTGTDTTFDQILQFAAIRADSDLSELDRCEILCRPLPHVVLVPGAMRVMPVMLTDSIVSWSRLSRVGSKRFKLRSNHLFDGKPNCNASHFSSSLLCRSVFCAVTFERDAGVMPNSVR